MNPQIFLSDGRGLVLIKFIPTVDVHDLRVIFFGGGEKFFQRVRQNVIVAVDEANIFSARMFDAGVACRTETEIFFVAHEADFIVAAVKFLAQFGSTVGRGVVDENYLKILEGLRQNAVDANFYILLDFVHRHDDGNCGTVIHDIASKKIFIVAIILSAENFFNGGREVGTQKIFSKRDACCIICGN